MLGFHNRIYIKKQKLRLGLVFLVLFFGQFDYALARSYTTLHSCSGYSQEDKSIKHLLDIGTKNGEITFYSYRSINEIQRTCHLEAELGTKDVFGGYSKWEKIKGGVRVTSFDDGEMLEQVKITKINDEAFRIEIPTQIKPDNLCGISATISREAILEVGKLHCKIVGKFMRYDD